MPPPIPQYVDRLEGGRDLAQHLKKYANQKGVIVLGLPRGGVPVAFAVAEALKAPLDVFVVRKLGVPRQPELAMGAIASGGVLILNQEVITALRIPPAVIEGVQRREQAELERREKLYRGAKTALRVKEQVVLLIDDGIATGSSVRAAVKALKALSPRKIIVASPVAAESSCRELREEANEVVCPFTPDPFMAVGCWYRDFTQTTDAEVHEYLNRPVA